MESRREKRTDVVRVGLKPLKEEPAQHGFTREPIPLPERPPHVSTTARSLRDPIGLPEGVKRPAGQPWSARYARSNPSRTEVINDAGEAP